MKKDGEKPNEGPLENDNDNTPKITVTPKKGTEVKPPVDDIDLSGLGDSNLPPQQPQQYQPQPAQYGPSGPVTKRIYKRSGLRSAGQFMMLGWFSLVIVFSIYLIILSNSEDFYQVTWWEYQSRWITMSPFEQAQFITDYAEDVTQALTWNQYILNQKEYDIANIVVQLGLTNEIGIFTPAPIGTDYYVQHDSQGNVLDVVIAEDYPVGGNWQKYGAIEVNLEFPTIQAKTNPVGLSSAETITTYLGVTGWFRGALGIGMVVIFALYLKPTTKPTTVGTLAVMFLGWIAFTLFFALFRGTFVYELIGYVIVLPAAFLMYYGSTKEIAVIKSQMPQQQMQPQPQPVYGQPAYGPNPYGSPHIPQQQGSVDQVKMKHWIQIKKFRIFAKLEIIKKANPKFVFHEVEMPTQITNVGQLNQVLDNLTVSEKHLDRKAAELKISFDDNALTKEGFNKFNINNQIYFWYDFSN